MVLRFGQRSSSKVAGKGEDVTSLIAKKNYVRAIELIKEQLKSPRGAEPRLRMQLADVLVLAGKSREAVMILTPLADEFAREGFAAKAIAVLKKIQKIDPTRREVEEKLASLIQEKQQQASVAVSSPGPSLEIGMEEIGFEPPAGGSIAVPVEDRTASIDIEPSVAAPSAASPLDPPQPFPKPEPPPPPQPMPRPEPLPPAQPTPAPAKHVEIEEAGIELEAEPLPEAPPIPERSQPAERPIIVLEPEPEPGPAEPVPTLEPEPVPELSLAPEAAAVAPAASEPEFVLDDEDEFRLDEGGPAGEVAPEAVAPEVVAPEADAPEVEAETEVSEPVPDNVFVDELMSVLEEAFPSGLEAPFTQPIAPSPSGSAQIVVSPLFRHFSVDEMVDVIAGLNLVGYERGQVIIREGEPGHSLFMLSSGKVKAFRKGPGGKQVPIAVLEEGAFFGEGAMLTGKPRTASIVALEECELLELDRATLDSIVQRHPHVMDVMREFAAERAVGR